ncbi:AIPR family protein [Sulfurimonas sp.]
MISKTNDQILLEQIIKEKAEESEGELSPSDYFEIYSASEILKNYDMTYDDISYGNVGSSADGGIDSFFIFINGELIKEDTDINFKQKKNHIELIVIQSKTSPNFKEEAINKFRESAQDLFNLSHNLNDYVQRYNAELLSKITLFRNIYSKLATSFPTLDIKYFYASQGTEIHKNVKGKVKKLEEDIRNMFSSSNFSFQFIGATELLQMTRDIPSSSRLLEVAESPIGTTEGSYLCLVSLSKYFEFISDEGSLARSIFESNVRDYQGSVIVNTGIKTTLENENSDNFWYLNNGVTIITPKAVLAGKQLTIEDPQIVNGLQTSHEIYQHFSNLEKIQFDNRLILVRIISEKNENSRDSIIRATNSQTAIPPASLRSSDQVHRNIEDFLKSNGYYYDRKKNYYKNMGMPIAKIISIPHIAQIMMSIFLLKPNIARSRPSTLINSDAEYKKIFSLDNPIDIYLKAVQIMKSVESYLKTILQNGDIERKTITNIRYYVAMLIGLKLANSEVNIMKSISELPNIIITDEMLKTAYNKVIKQYNLLGATDTIAKSSQLLEALLTNER